MVDFGRGFVVGILIPELSPIRLVAPDIAAPDSVEGQLRSEGQRWQRTAGRIGVGSYVEDILPGRLQQPKGRGHIGKVKSFFVDENGRAVAMVDFGRGWVVGIFMPELSPIRIVPPGRAALDSVEGQSDSNMSNPTDGFYKTIIDQESGRYATVNSDKTVVTLKDKAGNVIWSANVVEVTRASAEMSGERTITSMKVMDGALVVGIARGFATIDQQTCEVKWLGSR